MSTLLYLNHNIDTTITINYYYLIITLLLIHLNTLKKSNSEEHVWPRIRQHPYKCH
jgi:hypothetical protein